MAKQDEINQIATNVKKDLKTIESDFEKLLKEQEHGLSNVAKHLQKLSSDPAVAKMLEATERVIDDVKSEVGDLLEATPDKIAEALSAEDGFDLEATKATEKEEKEASQQEDKGSAPEPSPGN